MNRRFQFLLQALLLSCGPVAQAADGALEINQDCALAGCFPGDNAGFPVTIAAGGSYVLTSDLDVSALNTSTSGIAISAPASAVVGLDLAGHTINGGASCAGNPVTSCSTGGGDRGIHVGTIGLVTRIHDGAIRGVGRYAIFYADPGSGSSLEDITVSEIPGSSAIAIQGSGNPAFAIRNLRLTRCYRGGVVSFSPLRLTIDDSLFAGSGSYGLQLDQCTLTLRGSTFADHAIPAFLCSGTAALEANSFVNNNLGGANSQWSVTTVRDMGGNACLDDGTCP